MADLRTPANAAYRDFVTDGVPASGANEPSKSAIRALWATAETAIDSVETTAESAVAGIRWTPYTIRVRTTANVTLASALENGDTLNGVTLATGDHVFVACQSTGATITDAITGATNAPTNGIYTVVASGTASRATFADSAAELARIGFVVRSGTVGTGERWVLPLATADITVGTTGLHFAPAGLEVDYGDEVEALEAIVDGGLARVTALAYAGMASASSVTVPGNTSAGSAGFSGWAVVADAPATISTNAVLVSRILRATGLSVADQFSSLRIVLRTHATAPEGASATLVAVATPLVLQGEGDLLDVYALWRDPVTNAPITVTQASLAAKILIGYQGLKPNGSGADQVGVQYATTRDVALANASLYRIAPTSDARTDVWTINATADLNISLLSLTTPVETTETTFTEGTARSRGLPVNNTVNPSPFAPILTPRWFGVQGVEGRIQTWGMTAAGSAKAAFGTTGGVGKTMNDRWSWGADIGITVNNSALPVTVLDTDFMTTRATGSTQIKVVGPTAAAAKAINLVCMGDSKTNSAIYTARVLAQKAAYPNGVQPTLIGTKGAGSNKHEGRDGWTLRNYYESTTAGSDSNPFINVSGKFNATHWRTNNSLAIPDAVFIELGVNDVFSATSDAEVHLIMSSFIDMANRIIGLTADAAVGSWKELNANIVTILATCPPPAATQDGFGVVYYTTGQTMWRYKRNAAIASRRIIDAFSGLEGSKVYLFPYHTSVDPVAGYTGATDGIHENTTGYNQLGDALWAALNVLAVEGAFP